MALYAIGDLHLSLAKDKPMDIFGPHWKDHDKRLKENFSFLGPDDVTVICGDLSWAINLDEAVEDFKFIDSLPGKKYILKGNHDYWFVTASKLKAFFEKHSITTIELLHNNCGFYGDVALCGTKGWFYEESQAGGHDEKIFRRELGRLETSLKAAGDKEKYCFLHYPPIYDGYRCPEILDLLKKYDVKLCCYGHLHGPSIRLAIEGDVNGVCYKLVAADAVDFAPVKIL